MGQTADRHLTQEQLRMESLFAKYGKGAALVICGVIIVAALYFGLLYFLTLQ